MTSIFDIAGVVPTQQQQERIDSGNLVVAQPAPQQPAYQREDLVGNNQLLSRLAFQRGAQVGRGFGEMPTQQTLAQSAKQAYMDADRARYHKALFQADALAAQPANRFSQFLGAITGLPIGGISQYTGKKMGEHLRAGGVPHFGNNNLLGVTDQYGRYTGYGEDPTVTAMNKKFGFGDEGNRRQVVLPETDVATGAKRCADGYVFDEQLGACRLAVTLPNQPQQQYADDFYEVPYEDVGLLGGYGANLFYG